MAEDAVTTTANSNRPVTKREFALSEIRRMILGGEVGPAEKLPLRPLATRLGVSVMPVRDALRALESEGLVVIDDHRGAHVVDVSREEVIEAVGLRMWIQVYATRAATPKHTVQSLRRVRQALEAGAKACAKGDGQAFSIANRTFHETVEAPAGALVTQMIEDLWNRLWQVRGAASLFALAPERMQAAQVEHERITGAIAAGDADRATAEMEQHRTETLRAWRDTLAGAAARTPGA